jgi:hypothetical protein
MASDKKNDMVIVGQGHEAAPVSIDTDIVQQIKDIIAEARSNVMMAVNHELLLSYWQIGKLISARERAIHMNESTARQFILSLSKILTKELGRGFSRSNLFNMRNFHLNYNDVQTVSGQLSWSHYCELFVKFGFQLVQAMYGVAPFGFGQIVLRFLHSQSLLLPSLYIRAG